MGRILELCGEVAAVVEEGVDGIMLPADAWERFKDDFTEEEVEDALSLVRENLLQSELVEAADSLSARLVELLGAYGDASAFARVEAGGASLGLEAIGQIARRVNRMEEVLDVFRSDPPPDRSGFDALRERLANLGLEDNMEDDIERPEPRDDEEEDDN